MFSFVYRNMFFFLEKNNLFFIEILVLDFINVEEVFKNIFIGRYRVWSRAGWGGY